MTITVIGKSGFLARALAERPEAKDWRFLSHQEALSDTSWVEDATTVFNLALHPNMKTHDYNPAKDIDRVLAELIKGRNIHYVMASSRMVYGFAPDDLYLREDMLPNPETTYGRNKWETEQALAQILPEQRLTILRMGNIIGFEVDRPSFMGMALTKLRDDGVMDFNIAPDSLRDFLPVTFWAEIVTRVLQHPKPGVYNVGSGFGTSTDEIACWLMETMGQGKTNYTALSYDGQFIMDITKIKQAYEFEAISKVLLKVYVQNLARRLKKAA